MSKVCSKCGESFDFRGPSTHHRKHKKMGGRKGTQAWRFNLPISVPSEPVSEIESEDNLDQNICGRCHSAEHGIKECDAK